MRDLFFYFTFAVGSPFDTSENFYNYILLISLYHHLVRREKFLQDNYIIPATHPLCVTRIFLNFHLHILSIKKSSVHHLNTREYFYVKNLQTPRVQRLNSSKKLARKK